MACATRRRVLRVLLCLLLGDHSDDGGQDGADHAAAGELTCDLSDIQAAAHHLLDQDSGTATTMAVQPRSSSRYWE